MGASCGQRGTTRFLTALRGKSGRAKRSVQNDRNLPLGLMVAAAPAGRSRKAHSQPPSSAAVGVRDDRWGEDGAERGYLRFEISEGRGGRGRRWRPRRRGRRYENHVRYDGRRQAQQLPAKGRARCRATGFFCGSERECCGAEKGRRRQASRPAGRLCPTRRWHRRRHTACARFCAEPTFGIGAHFS